MACFESSPTILSVQKATSNFSRVSWIQTKFDPTSFSVKTPQKFRLTIYTNKRVRNGMDRDKLLLALWIVWFFWNPSAYQHHYGAGRKESRPYSLAPCFVRSGKLTSHQGFVSISSRKVIFDRSHSCEKASALASAVLLEW